MSTLLPRPGPYPQQQPLAPDPRYNPGTLQDSGQPSGRTSNYPALAPDMIGPPRPPSDYPQRPEDTERSAIAGQPGKSGWNADPSASSRAVKPGPRKRPRQSSASQADRGSPSSVGNAGGPGQRARPGDSPGKTEHPAVLVREKKQKACANCRRAKLKCIVEGDGDCVRCKARKEKCVFYPRSHDEDWQQTLTNDVYSALHHLSHLSSAVHHLLYHLTAQTIIPPFRTEDGDMLSRYETPDRDMAVLQGWGADRNKEFESKRGQKRRGPGAEQDKGEEEEYEGERAVLDDPNLNGPENRSSISSSMPSYGYGNGFPHRHMNMSVERFPPNGWTAPGLPNPPLPPFDPPQTMGTPESGRFAELAPFRPQGHPGQIQLTPTSELELPQPPFYSGISISPQPSNSASMPPPAPFAPPQQGTSIISPSSMPNETPTSMPQSSPVVDAALGSSSDVSVYRKQSRVTSFDESPGAPPLLEAVGALHIQSIIPDNVQIGIADHRFDVISKNIVSQQDARILLTYFHQRLAPLLFGYRLELGRFPYLPEGPSAITPLILGVICLYSSERLPQYMHMHAGIADVVTELLLNNPAESWQGLEETVVEDRDSNDSEIDKLNPELGIGPEEIIGAAVVSLYAGERGEAARIAESAFRWARGWIKLLSGPPRNSVAELMQIVPAERAASSEDMSRVWLLCFIVEGTEAIVAGGPNIGHSFEPEPHCQTLLSATPGGNLSAHDVVLSSHARLVHIVREWFVQRQEIHQNSVGVAEASRQMQHLTLETNARLEYWHDELHSHHVPHEMIRETLLFWHFARAIVNELGATAFSAQPRLRTSRVAESVDGAMEFLDLCAGWEPKEDLANLPQNYLHMISTVGLIVRRAFEEPMCPVTRQEACTLLKTVGNMMYAGGLPREHNARNAGESVLIYAQQIMELSKGSG